MKTNSLLDEYFFRLPRSRSLALSLSSRVSVCLCSCLCVFLFDFFSQFFFVICLNYYFLLVWCALASASLSLILISFLSSWCKVFPWSISVLCGSKASGHTSFFLLPFCVCVCVCVVRFWFLVCSSDAASFSSRFLFQVLKFCCRFQLDSCGSRISPSVEPPGEVWLEVLVCM